MAKRLKFKPKFDFRLIAIVSQLDDYKMNFVLNKRLGFFLQESTPISIKDSKGNFSFPVYTYFDEERKLDINLILNKFEGAVLIKEQHQIDYFIQIYGEVSDDYIIDIKDKIKADKDILATNIVNLDDLKNKEKLLYL